MTDGAHTDLLLVRLRADLLGLPLSSVAETMRPLPCSPLPGAPPFVLGAALIRGVVTPVVDLAGALGRPQLEAPRRLVTVRAGARAVALAVDDVLGVRRLEAAQLVGLPPLLEPATAAVSALAVLDRELLLVLEAGHFVDGAADATAAPAPQGPP